MFQIELIHNLSLLVAASLLSGFIGQQTDSPRRHALLQGLLFGAAAMLGILSPAVVMPGLILDGRSVVLSLCALFFGPLAAAVAGVMAIVCRLWVGGVGAHTGALVILASCAWGTFFHYQWVRRGIRPSAGRLLTLALIVHTTMLALLRWHLPPPYGIDVVTKSWFLIMTSYPVATVLVGRVLDERQQQIRNQRALADQSELLTATLYSIGDAVITTDTAARVGRMNGMAERLTSWTEAAAVGRPLAEVLQLVDARTAVPADCPATTALARASRVERQGGILLINGLGRKIPISYTAAPIRDEAGRASGAVVVFRDKTHEIERERQLAERTEELALAQRVAGFGSWSFNPATGHCEWSAEMFVIWGRDPAAGAPNFPELAPMVAPGEMARIESAIDRAMESAEEGGLQFRILRPDGEIRHVECKARVERDDTGRVVRLYGTMQDITDSVRGMESLQANTELLRMAGQMAQLGGWLIDLTTGVLRWSDEVRAIHELGEEFVTTPQRALEFYPPEWRPIIAEAFWRCARNGTPYDLELELITARGRRLWVRTNGMGLRDSTGRITRVVGTLQDIDARKRQELQFTAVTNRLQGFLHYSPLLISEIDLDGRYLIANRATCEFLGQTPDKVIGTRMSDHLPAETLRILQERIDRIRRDGIPVIAEDVLPTPEGELRHFNTVLFPLYDANGQLSSIGGVSQDVTAAHHAAAERAAMEERLQQAQKMEAVGRLAGGVAHDFNNMLGVILGYADLALESSPAGSGLHEAIEEIRRAASRSAELTQQLLAFARRQTINPQLIELNGAVEKGIRMLRRLIGENIALEWRPLPSPCRVMLDPAQFDQILTNLTVNARDAMPNGGRLIVATSHQTLSEADAAARPGTQPGEFAVLTVTDTGVGMDAETLEHIFEPFFSTKGTGGTGLGLATVHGIANQNGGFVTVDSRPGVGSTFHVYFPLAGNEPVPATSAGVIAPPPPGTGTILVVEDEPALLELARTLLERLGYVVLATTDPAEGLRLAKEHPHTIQLLMSDLVMPGMSGLDLWRAVQAVRPGIRALFVSGYSADVLGAGDLAASDVHFLQKPYSLKELGARVREALG